MRSAWLLLLAACGGGEAKPPTVVETKPVAPVTPTAAAPAPDTSSASSLPASLRCDGGPLGPAIARPPTTTSQPAVAGQMTEQAAQAKRLFDAEKWDQALPAMLRVANGDTGDDTGNKQIAEYHAAIVLYRLKRIPESYAGFSALARNRSHLKHREALLWISKIAATNPDVVNLSDLAFYGVDDVNVFDNTQQRDTHRTAAYLVARERMQQTPPVADEAKLLFGKLSADHPWAADAKKCLAKL